MKVIEQIQNQGFLLTREDKGDRAEVAWSTIDSEETSIRQVPIPQRWQKPELIAAFQKQEISE